jgi:hypothetical protein
LFQTVRHWWGSGHGKATARLFLFEFVVVVAGVLVAQALAGYVQQQSDLARMEAERSRIHYELTTAHSIFRTWRAGIPCLNQRMTEVMIGTDFSPNAMLRPALPAPDFTPPATDVLDLIAKRHGLEEKDRLIWVAMNVAGVYAADGSIGTIWGRLTLIDPAFGPVTAADQAEARVAAADIKAQLRRIEVLSDDATMILTKMGIAARNQSEPNYGPAKSCAAIWKSGRLDPPLDAR